MAGDRLLIIGSGPAGYTAAIYGIRAGLHTEIVSGMQPGGQLTITTEVDNWPGSAGILGPDLMKNMEKHCLDLGCKIHEDTIQKFISLGPPFLLQGESSAYEGDAVILASGSSAKMLGLKDEEKYIGRGLSTCATCDGFFYRGKRVAVIGGGNTAAEEALFLAGLAKQVFLVHRRDQLRADAILQKRLFALEQEKKLIFLWNRTVADYIGDQAGLKGLLLIDEKQHQQESLDLEGVFIAIGHTPNTDFVGKHMQLNNGYVRVRGKGIDHTATSRAGIFAAGDVADPHYRQAITSAGMGCMAALDAKRYLDTLK